MCQVVHIGAKKTLASFYLSLVIPRRAERHKSKTKQPYITMTKRSIITLAAVSAVIASTAFAGPAKMAPAKTVKAPAPQDCVTGDVGLDITSDYYFHGILQQGSGFIAQPYGNLYFKVSEGGFFDSVSVDVGIWNSFHSRRGNVGQNNNWYEFDFTAGLTLNKGNWSISPKYLRYSSPGNYFNNSSAVALRIGYNDSDMLGAFSLQPYLWVEYEADGISGNGTGEGLYYELGVSPSRTFGDLTVSLPIKLGLGSNGYYAGDETYGYASIGVTASYALKCIPECLGDWSVYGNATFMHLGNGTDIANGGDDTDVTFTGGLKIAF
jgi:hypothetical protein